MELQAKGEECSQWRQRHVQKSWGRAESTVYSSHWKKSLELEGEYIQVRMDGSR